MLLSIITVCYNSADTIRKTFDSVLSQDCVDYEYVVIDGASTDGTVDIIKEYVMKFASSNYRKVKYISEPDHGIYDAMNKGVLKSSGRFLLFLNSGDYLASNDVIGDLNRLIEESSAEIVRCGIYCTTNGKYTKTVLPEPYEKLKTGAFWFRYAIPHPGTLLYWT